MWIDRWEKWNDITFDAEQRQYLQNIRTIKHCSRSIKTPVYASSQETSPLRAMKKPEDITADNRELGAFTNHVLNRIEIYHIYRAINPYLRCPIPVPRAMVFITDLLWVWSNHVNYQKNETSNNYWCEKNIYFSHLICVRNIY